MTETTETPIPAARPPRWRLLRYATRGLALLLPAALIALLVYGVIAKNPNTSIDDHLARAQPIPAPSFELDVLERGNLGSRLADQLAPALADDRLSLQELRGVPVVLNFWASWCVPCREEAPLLQRTWATEARPHGVLFLGIDMQDITDDARDFLHEFRIDYVNIRDPSNPVARSYGVTGVPETFFVDRRGRVVSHVVGVTSREQLRAGIAAASSGRVAGAQQGGAQRKTG